MPYFPLASGVLTGKYRRGEAPPEGTRLAAWGDRGRDMLTDERIDVGRAAGASTREAHGHTLAELALSWLAACPAVGERDRRCDHARAGARQRRRHRRPGSSPTPSAPRSTRSPRGGPLTGAARSRVAVHRPCHRGRSPTSRGARARRLRRRARRPAASSRRARCSSTRSTASARREPRPATPAGLRDPAALVASFPAPTVAVWNGPAIGAGAEVLLAADLRVVGPAPRWRSPRSAHGELPCWGGTQRLPRAAGVALALRAARGRRGARRRRARALRARGPGRRSGRARRGARRRSSRAARPRAQAAAREAVQRGRDLTLAEGYRLESDLNLLLSTTDDRAEGIAAFFDKRPPRFRGE